ncbi:MAG: SRPBCC family protein [Chloroflexota bacterium]
MGANATIHVVETVTLGVPLAVAWAWLADLERLTTIGVFHRAARFDGARRFGVGARLIVDHGFALGPALPRLVRITHWDEGRRIRWTEVGEPLRKYAFPHSQEFRLAPLSASATLLTDEVRGTFNLPLVRRPADRLLEIVLTRRVLKHECATLQRQIR